MSESYTTPIQRQYTRWLKLLRQNRGFEVAAAIEAKLLKVDARRKKLVDKENARVYWAYMESRGPKGATDDEAQVSLAMDSQAQVPIRIACASAGLVTRTDQMRETRDGELAYVWVRSADAHG